MTIGGKPGSFLNDAIANYVTMLEGRLGRPIPEMHPSLQFQRKILATYVEVCGFLRQGQPLSDEEREVIEDCIARWERLLVKMKAHKSRYGEIRLWAEGAAQREPGNRGAHIFDSWDLWCMREALAEYLTACRLVGLRGDLNDDENAELGNDVPLYEIAYDEISQARQLLLEEIRDGKAPPD